MGIIPSFSSFVHHFNTKSSFFRRPLPLTAVARGLSPLKLRPEFSKNLISLLFLKVRWDIIVWILYIFQEVISLAIKQRRSKKEAVPLREQ